MRTKSAIYNNFSAGLLQIVILLFGLITPRLMIQSFGSEINGLISSSKQIVAYLNYLELGITSALIYSLYLPMSKQNFEEINPIVSRTKQEYYKVSILYFIGVILISFLYPLLLNVSFRYEIVILIVFFIGMYGTLDFFTLAKYRVLLEADQRGYIINFT